MNAENIRELIDRLSKGNEIEQLRAASSLSQSGDERGLDVIGNVLENLDKYPRSIRYAVIDGLIAGAPKTIDFLISHLKEFPLSRGGRDSAYALGEIVSSQASRPDARILPALLEAVNKSLPAGTRANPEAVGAILDIARLNPIPEANDTIESLLSIALQEKEPYLPVLRVALNVLYINQGRSLIDKLHHYLQELAPDQEAAIVIRQFIDTINKQDAV